MLLSLISNLAIALILTIAIEIFVAFLVGYKDKSSIIIIALVNIITNPIINYLVILNRQLHYFNYNLGLVLFLEIFVIIIEWRMIIYAFDNKYNNKLLLLSILMNLASFLLGIIIFGPIH